MVRQTRFTPLRNLIHVRRPRRLERSLASQGSLRLVCAAVGNDQCVFHGAQAADREPQHSRKADFVGRHLPAKLGRPQRRIASSPTLGIPRETGRSGDAAACGA
jgi:hypothetical protein